MIKRLEQPIPFHPYPVGPPGIILKYRCYDGEKHHDCVKSNPKPTDCWACKHQYKD